MIPEPVDQAAPPLVDEMRSGQQVDRTENAASVPLIGRADVYALASLPLDLMVACCVPERRWRLMTGLIGHLRVQKSARLRHHIRSLLGCRRLEVPVEAVAAAYLEHSRIPKLHLLRLHMPPARPPPVGLEGREHLERALAGGRGAILWVAPFMFSSLFSKLALPQAGFTVSHLSRYGHGFSRSAFGERFLNPLFTRIESRYVERIVIGRDDAMTGPMKAVRHRLAQNAVVSITVHAQGRQVLSAPVFEGVLGVAAGAPKLMLHSGAALLPVFAVWRGAAGYVTLVDPPIRAPQGLDQPAAVAAVIEELGRRLERQALRWPDQFLWEEVMVRPRQAASTAASSTH